MTKELLQQVTSSVIAILVVGGTLALVSYQVIKGQAPNIPSDLSLLLGGVVGAYFTHQANVNGARQAGTAAAQVAVDNIVARNGVIPDVTTNP